MRALIALSLLGLCACAPADPAVFAEQRWAICQGSGFEQQRLEACSDVIDSAAVAPSRRAEALVQRGAIRSGMTQDARAVADFGRALRLDPTFTRAYLERAQLHFDRDAFDAAVRDYDHALRLDPYNGQAAHMREVALRSRSEEQLDELDVITRALAEQPNNPALWNNRCWVRAVSGEELDFALADCNEALRLNPRHAAALDSRGLVHLKRGEYLAAIDDYNAALALDPGRGHYLYGRGVAHTRMGNIAAGRADLVEAERAEPGIGARYRSYGVAL